MASDSRATEIIDWLFHACLVSNDDSVDPMYPQASSFALRNTTASQATGIVTIARGEMWVAGDGTTPPVCPTCGHETDWDVLEQWSTDHLEPRERCRACGHEDFVGNWDLERSMAIGPVALIFQNATPEAARRWCHTLRQALGGRWAYVHHHL